MAIEPPKNDWLKTFKVRENAPLPMAKPEQNRVDKDGTIHYEYNSNLTPEQNAKKRDEFVRKAQRRLGLK